MNEDASGTAHQDGWPDPLNEARRIREDLGQGREMPRARVLAAVKSLEEITEFEEARFLIGSYLLTVKETPGSDAEVLRELVFCTYMSDELPPQKRYTEAMSILREGVDLASDRVGAAFLGLAGAISKRQWETEGDHEALERAHLLYRRGSGEGGSDGQYCAVNAAFVLDLLSTQAAKSEQSVGYPESRAAMLRLEARAIRLELTARWRERAEAEGDHVRRWYALISGAEAYLGLGDVENATVVLGKASEVDGVPAWRYASAVSQLATVVSLNTEGSLRTEAAAAIADAFGLVPGAVEGRLGGRMGLALSGGGFRAALFHVGVLRALAEAGRLRSLEVLSCVSGGSIVGAVYYLQIKRLLEAHCDCKITHADFVNAVKSTEDVVRRLAESDLRARVFANPWRNFRMLLVRGWSRTSALAEMLQRELRQVGPAGSGAPGEPLSALAVEPFVCQECAARRKGLRSGGGFSPNIENWARAAKVPILVLNATTLNTGHAWQFTASWTGEPPAQMDAQMDALPRLRRVRLRGPKASEALRGLGLAEAVAISAAVPGLLAPASLRGVFGDVDVRLVDGGVHDNQGVEGLLDQGCARVVVSDASGQMEYQKRPGACILGFPWRANAILQARVRELQLESLEQKRRAGVLRELIIVHLTKHLQAEAISEERSMNASRPSPRRDPTSYRVRWRVQQALALMRTDLDSFCPLEANALAESGYRMTGEALGLSGGPGGVLDPPPVHVRILELGRYRCFKLTRFVSYRIRVFVAAALALTAVAVLAPAVLAAAVRLVAQAPTVVRAGISILAMALFGPPLVSGIKLLVGNRIYRQLSRPGRFFL